MNYTNQYYPVAIALTNDWGWQAIYEGFDFRGLSFEKVFWLRSPSDELGLQVELCTSQGKSSELAGGENMLVPELYRMIKSFDIEFDLEKIKEDGRK